MGSTLHGLTTRGTARLAQHCLLRHVHLRGLIMRLLRALLLITLFGYVGPVRAGPQGWQEASLEQYAPGTIVISQSQRRLFLVEGGGEVRTYRVAVGKAGKAWLGSARIAGKFVEPSWSPPADVKHDNPRLPNYIEGGAPHNPMGARALTLDRSEIAIHGTSRSMRASIGQAASYGCIRMLNEDVVDLFDRVRVGTPVVAIP
jgi:lipoprotein-anchoring transpeptidase ErfK/SrfK